MARGQRKPAPTASDVAVVVHRMAQGEALAAVAGELGMAVAAIRKVLVDLGYPTRPTPPPPPVIRREDVEAELARLREGVPTSAGAPTLATSKPVLDSARVPAEPLKARLQEARLHGRSVADLARAVAAIRGELREGRHDALVKNLLNGLKTLSRTDAAVMAEVLHLAPVDIWPDWDRPEAVSA